jgi:hypothetical protein
MLDLKTIIEQYPRSVGTRAQLASLLHDLYPTEKREVNVALAVYDSGIASRISSLKSLNSVLLHLFTKQLVDEFGLQEQFAEEGIEVWAKAYGLSVKKDNAEKPYAIPQKNITHNPNAYAQPEVVNGSASDYELEQTPEGYIISKFRGFDESNVVIPNTIDGKKIVGIGKTAYMGCTTMRTLVISDGIEFIENGAFARCENLSKVIFPATLIRIGSLEQPNSLNFGSAEKPDGAFDSCGFEEVVLPRELKKLGKGTFSGCKQLVSIDIPNGITKIEKYTFSICPKLNDVRFPSSLREIGWRAFFGCSALAVVVLNEGLEIIAGSAFGRCTSLSKILIPSTVSEIKDDGGYDMFGNSRVMPSGIPKPTIYCYAGSYGLEYARKKGYPIKNAANFPN